MRLLSSIIFLVNIFMVSFLVANQDFSSVKPGYNWSFPRDHGSHPEFRTEWWYYTGHISTKAGKTFGFEVTFFRNSENQPSTNSLWQVDQLFLAHFALTDDQEKKFYHSSRTTRPSFNMAGAAEGKLAVHNGNWQVEQQGAQIYLTASMPQASIELQFNSAKPPILQGDKGYSKKSNSVDMASYYYSIPRLEGSGQIRVQDKIYQDVNVSAWFDHEFFSHSLLSSNQEFGTGDVLGWDWFAIQLDNQQELMLYRVRHKITNQDYYFGSWINSQGDYEILDQSAYKITALDSWESKKSKSIYPQKWRVEVPDKNMDITITPTVKNQELFFGRGNALNYWEGRCLITGTHEGNAYVELAGYDGLTK